MWVLIAIAGPDKGQAHALDATATRDTPIVLGREGSPFCLSDRRASRRHAAIFRENGRWCVDDLGSTTGTLRNHKVLSGTQPLRDGDFLQVGRTVFTVSKTGIAAAQALEPALSVAQAASGPGNALPPRPVPRGLAAWVLGAGSAAAVVLIGLAVVNQQQAARLAGEIRLSDVARAAAEQRADERVAELELRLLEKLGNEERRAATLERSLRALAPAQERTTEALSDMREAVADGQHQLASSLAHRDQAQSEAMIAGLAEATARRLRPEIGPLLPPELLAAVDDLRQKVDALPERIVPGVDQALDTAVATLAQAQRAAGRELVDAVDSATQSLEQSLPTRAELHESIARVESRLERLPDASVLDARLASISAALEQNQSADPAREAGFTELREALAALASDLKDRPDAAALRSQLEDVAAKRPVAPDPILAQVLAGMTAQRAAAERIAADLSRLAEEGGLAPADAYDAEDLARRVVAALPASLKEAAAIGEPSTATPIDSAALAAAVEAALAGTALADAGSLRELVRNEVSFALERTGPVGSADGTHGNGLTDRRALERAYRRAFETNRKDILPGGRILDPTAARAAGVTSWRDWYLVDEFAERMRLAREASRIRGTLEDPTIVGLPSR